MTAREQHEINQLRDRVLRLTRLKARVDAGEAPGPAGLDEHLRQRVEELRALEHRLAGGLLPPHHV